jgi:hypothetical protein
MSDNRKRPAAGATAKRGAEGAQLDQEPAQLSTKQPFLEAALDLASRGFRVFPLIPNDWRPAIKNWVEAATVSDEQIRVWSSRWPQANVGVATGQGLVVVDIDNKEGKNGSASFADLGVLIEALDTFTVATPSGGRHVYYSGPDIPNSAGRLGSGLDVRGAGGYVVGPGSFLPEGAKNGQRGGRYEILVTSDPRPLPNEILPRLARSVERQVRHLAEAIDVDRPGAIAAATEYLDHTAPLAIEGTGGDHTAFVVAARLKDFGISENMTFDLMADRWNDRCEPPWELENLRTKVCNAYRYGENPIGSQSPEVQFNGVEVPRSPARNRPASKLHHLGEAGSTLAVDWLIKEWLPKAGVALIGGQSRVGKSFLAISLAGATATGGLFFGRPVRERVGVLYVAGEGATTMRPRLEALRQRLLAGIAPVELPIVWAEVDGPREIEGIIAEAAVWMDIFFDVRLGVIVIDTLAAVFNVLDENDAHEATGAMQHLQRLSRDNQCLVLGVTHFGKHADAGVRGSSAWTASADVVFAATAAINEATGEVKDRRFALTKSRLGDTGPISGFELDVVLLGVDLDGDPIGAAVVRPCAAPAKRRRASQHVPLLLECVMEVIAKEPTDVGGRAMASRNRVRALFGQRITGSRDSGNATRAFNGAAIDAAIQIEAMGGMDYFSLP